MSFDIWFLLPPKVCTGCIIVDLVICEIGRFCLLIHTSGAYAYT